MMIDSDTTDGQRSSLFFSLTTRQTLFAACLAMLAVAASGWVGYAFARQSLREQIESRFELLLRERGMRLRNYIGQQHERAQLVASRTQLRSLVNQRSHGEIEEELFTERIARILDDAAASNRDIVSIVIADASGRVIAGTTGTDTGWQLPASHISIGLNRTFLHPPRVFEGKLICELVTPVVGTDSRPTGIIRIAMRCEHITDILTCDPSIGLSGRICCLAPNQDKMHCFLPTPQGDVDELCQLELFRSAPESRSSFRQVDLSGRRVLASWRPIELQSEDVDRWGLLGHVDVDEVFHPIRQYQTHLVWLILGFMLASMLLAYLGARRLSMPLQRLTTAARLLESHQQFEPIQDTGRDEVGALARAFNAMAREVNDSQLSLADRADRLEELNSRLEVDLELAQRVQECLYPAQDLKLPGWDISGLSIPAERLCGDYFDYFVSPRGTVVVAVGDVSGHGVGPALLMVETRAILHSIVDNGIPIDRWGGHLNNLLYHDSPPERFVSLFFAEIDQQTRQVRYAGAGHDARILRDSGTIDYLESTGMVLGIAPLIELEVKQVQLHPGDCLFVSTDGITETFCNGKVLYDETRLERHLLQHRKLPVAAILETLVANVVEYRQDSPQIDDLTAIGVRPIRRTEENHLA
ncbi:MAG: SpoIIE family protein phosphatase [Planctomycetaceae bacterium]